MPGVTGITPIPSFRFAIQPEAGPHERHGSPVNPIHGDVGERAQPYPWEEFAGPHGPEEPLAEYLDENSPESRTLAAGYIEQDPSGDYTKPYHSHGGPHITGFRMDRGPEGNAEVLAQSWEAHGVRTNAAEKGRASSNPLQDTWIRFWNTIRGEDLVPPLPTATGPAVFGFGNNDRVSNPFHKENQFGLHASHRLRRYAQSPIPGNTMWMQPAGRPMQKSIAGTSRPAVGPGPFYGQDVSLPFGIEGAILMDPATEYVAPAGPRVSPQTQATSIDIAPDVPLW